MGIVTLCLKLIGGGIGASVLFIAAFLAPALYPPTLKPLSLADVKSWGVGKGPAASKPGFPMHLAGLYYLDGNVAQVALVKAVQGDFSLLMAGDRT